MFYCCVLAGYALLKYQHFLFVALPVDLQDQKNRQANISSFSFLVAEAKKSVVRSIRKHYHCQKTNAVISLTGLWPEMQKASVSQTIEKSAAEASFYHYWLNVLSLSLNVTAATAACLWCCIVKRKLKTMVIFLVVILSWTHWKFLTVTIITTRTSWLIDLEN